MKKLLAALPGVSRDGMGIVGIALISYGTWRIYAPAGFIVAGLLLLSIAVLVARAE